jgi:hypothetical protein
VPDVVTKKTVFKWQEVIIKIVFNFKYKNQSVAAGLIQLQHHFYDAATMQVCNKTSLLKIPILYLTTLYLILDHSIK